MLRHQLSRIGGLALVVAVVGLACLTLSCGGGGYAAKDMVLVEFLFVDRSLVPTAPTGTENLPRNAQMLLVFSELVDTEHRERPDRPDPVRADAAVRSEGVLLGRREHGAVRSRPSRRRASRIRSDSSR